MRRPTGLSAMSCRSPAGLLCMGRTLASITTSIDGYVTGPDDGPEAGLGIGGERLHNWVMGGLWTYDAVHHPGQDMGPVDREFMASFTATVGAGICGRGMFE